uniref:Uncharacterized protein n=1 Tax=Raphanus sativus TaxID=3726 RepID=A0A650GBC2_RAPSA|nr:hypothetical protein [Raphanus sativus]
MNSALTASPSDEEIKAAVFSIQIRLQAPMGFSPSSTTNTGISLDQKFQRRSKNSSPRPPFLLGLTKLIFV